MKVVQHFSRSLTLFARSISNYLCWGKTSAIALLLLSLCQHAEASGGPPTATCPTNVLVSCASLVPTAATDSTTFISQGGSIVTEDLTHEIYQRTFSCVPGLAVKRQDGESVFGL